MARPFKGQEQGYPILNCKICGKDFKSRMTFSYMAKHPDKKFSNFCSRECMQKWRHVPKVLITCEICGEKKYIHRSDIKYGRGRFCSKKCNGKFYTGERASKWKGGKTSEAEKLRKSPEYIAWRVAVFIRDNRTCVWCGSKKDIEADHIKPRAFYPELTLDIDNGRTLCHDCHTKTPNYFKSYMTKAQYESMML